MCIRDSYFPFSLQKVTHTKMALHWLSISLIALFLFIVFRIAKIFIDYVYKKQKLKIPSLPWYSVISLHSGNDSLWTQKNGDRQPDMIWVGINIGGDAAILVSNPELMKEVMTLPKSPAFINVAKWVMGDGLVTSEGDVWRFYRKAITPLFHFAPLKNMIPVMQNRIDDWMNDIRSHPGEQYQVFDLFEKLTMATIIDLAFGRNFDVDWMLPRFKRLGDSFGPLIMRYLFFGDKTRNIPDPFILSFNKLEKEVRDKVRQRIKLVKEQPIDENEPDNLMTMLLRLQKKDPNIHDEYIIDHCLTFLFAGNETVATTSCWVMYYVGKFPQYQESIHQEAKAVGQITSENINQLTWAKNVFSETMRFHPVLRGIARVNEQEMLLGGQKIPAGTTLIANVMGNHMDPSIWKNPKTFMPERWENEPTRHPYSYTPFSAGHRNCVGMKFAQQEAFMILANLMREFVVETNIKDNIKKSKGMQKPLGLTVSFTPRK
eukprot:TRINITY_DN54_c0_g1_i4.p1 TRINITY_DN54_c0_g1~~TRINITY_DN54_c0_g1_i4.p1  ORF type:complete len:488 (+),score=131.07 TRINITY_DN54_c0_g1_i4:53-1516(+)